MGGRGKTVWPSVSNPCVQCKGASGEVEKGFAVWPPTMISSFGVIRSGRVGFREEKTRVGCVFLSVCQRCGRRTRLQRAD